MSESSFNAGIREALYGWDYQRVETDDAVGFPDINHKHGWIESKWLPAWPKRANTVVRVDHYTQTQRVWHKRRARVGGRVHVLIKIQNTIILLRGDVAAKHLGKVTREELLKLASAYWNTKSGWKKKLKEAILADDFTSQLSLFED